jgi:radical SAM protein with 4Fe4S-binding SPASM domain
MYRKDAFNLLSKLNVRRLGNFSQLWLSYYFSKKAGQSYHRGMPAILEIEPTTSCNLRCPQCPSGLRQFTRNTGMLNFPLFKSIIDEVHKDLIWLVFYFQGEPFLNIQFLEFVSYAANKNIYVATSSNAHYFTDDTAKATVESKLSRLIISIDGITQESYSKYRIGGNLNKVIEGTQNILKWKKELKSSTPHVIWQFIVFKHNEDQLDTIKLMAAEMGVDQLDIKTAQVYDYESDSDFVPSNEALSRYKKNAEGKYEIKNSFLNQCWKMWRSSVITWDGLVVPCCFDKDAKHQFGDVSKVSFKDVWRSQPYHQFRNAILRGRDEIDICTNCIEGTE